MALPAHELVEALGGTAGSLPPAGVLHVVAVPRFDPSTTSLRAALVLAAADLVRRPPELPPDVLAPLVRAEQVAGTIRDLDPATLDLTGRRVVQLVASASQTAPVVTTALRRLHAAGVPLAVVGSTAELDASLLAAGVSGGVGRTGSDAVLDQVVLAADRPDVGDWRRALGARGVLDHTPVVLVERAGTPGQTAVRTTLGALNRGSAAGPVLLAVGDEVVGPVDWRGRLPLRGRVVANLRASHQAPPLTARLRDLGAAVVEAPLLTIEGGDAPGLARTVDACARGDVAALCLTSPNGVHALAEALAVAGRDARALAGVGTVACVGPGTAAVLWRSLSVRADLVAPVHTTIGLADALGPPGADGAVALLPRADLATPELAARLRSSGWVVEEVVAYRTRRRALEQHVADALADGVVDLVPVLSSSMADAVVAAGRERGVRGAFVSIGPVTSATLRGHGVEPMTEADPHDLDGLVDALVAAAARLAPVPPGGAGLT